MCACVCMLAMDMFESYVIHVLPLLIFPMENPPLEDPKNGVIWRPSAPAGWPRSVRRAPGALPSRSRWGRPWACLPGPRSPGSSGGSICRSSEMLGSSSGRIYS